MRLCDPKKIEEVRELLAEGKLSKRGIARVVGLSRGTVDKVAQGKYHPKREYKDSPGGVQTIVLCSEQGVCPKCHSRVYKPNVGWPCLACRAREFRERQGKSK